MAQRRRKRKPKIDLSMVIVNRPRRRLAENDNVKTSSSGLTFTEARKLERRIEDMTLLNQAKETRQKLC